MLLIGLGIYFGFTSTGSIGRWGKNYYSLSGNSIILSGVRALSPEGVTGYGTSSIDSGGRTWLKDFKDSGKVLEEKCIFTSDIKHRSGGGVVMIANFEGVAILDESRRDLTCDIGARTFNFPEKISNYRYTNVVVTWTFSEPSLTNPPSQNPPAESETPPQPSPQPEPEPQELPQPLSDPQPDTQEEPQQLNIFQQFWNWLKGLFA